MYKIFLKSILDFIFSTLLLFILSPFVLIISILNAFIFGGSPFFIQERIGKNNKIFKIVKFKTMYDNKFKENANESDVDRIGYFGSFLRKFSLDELPQLFNVIKGDMSLIGPRPLLPEYLQYYNEFQRRRHEIKPGITGWAQINGRNELTWNEKFILDVWYVDHLTIGLDLLIIFRTIKKVLLSDGVNSSQNITMERFTGDN